MVGEHEIQTFKILVVMLVFLLSSFDVFVPTSVTSLIISGQVVCPNILKCQFSQGTSFYSHIIASW